MNSGFNNDDEIEITWKIKKNNKFTVLFVSMLFVVILGITDYISGYEMSFSIFYLIPISLTVLLSDFKSGLFISILSTIVWYTADIYSGHTYQNILIPVWNAIMRSGYFVMHSYLFSRFIILYKKVKIDSVTDSLTGTINSRYFYELFEREVKKAKRTKLAFTLAYFDLDNFKLMNDTYGHQAGDMLLKTMSNLINDNIRPFDVFARLGGDEFALLLHESDFDESDTVIKRIKEIIDTELKIKKWPVTMSVGAITFRIFNKSIDEMIRQADHLMYSVKSNGKDKIEHHLDEK